MSRSSVVMDSGCPAKSKSYRGRFRRSATSIPVKTMLKFVAAISWDFLIPQMRFHKPAVALIVGALHIVLMASAAAEEKGKPLILSASPGGNERIVVHVAETKAGSTPVFLRPSPDGARVSRILAYVLEGDGKEGRVVSGTEITLMDDKKDLLREPPQAPLPAVQPAALAVRGIEATGVFTGRLIAQTEKELIHIVDFEIRRMPAPLVQWTEALDKKPIQIATNRGGFAHTFPLASSVVLRN